MKPLLIAMLACGACLQADGSGKVVTEQRKVDSFERIHVGGAIDLMVVVDDEPRVAVETDDNLQQYVIAEVRDKTLYLRTDGHLDPTRMLVRIVTPDLTAVDVSGASEATITGIDTKRFELLVSGAAEVDLEGEADVFVINASGASAVNATKLDADHVEIDSSGASELDVHANDTLIAQLTGAGELEYAGDPDEVKTDLSGAATVRKK